MKAQKYKCIETFSVGRFTEDGWDGTAMEVQEGSIWEEITGVSILGGEVHLENKETLGWLELPRARVDELFKPVTRQKKKQK